MTGIDTHLKTIKEGVFGRDVRQAIHDGIEQVYNDATFDGNTNMEVAKSRGEFNELSSRLANIDAQLNAKADAGEIATKLQNMASASPKGTYANLAALKADKPNGDTGIYITTDNKHWNYWSGTAWVSGGVYQASSVSPYDTFAFVAGNVPINFNNVTKTIEITGSNTYLLQGRLGSLMKESVPYPTSSGWVVIDTTTQRLSTTGNPVATHIVVGAIFNPTQAKPHIVFNGYHTIDKGVPVNASEVSSYEGAYIYIGGGKNVIFDKAAKKLIFPPGNIRIGRKNNPIEAFELALPNSSIFLAFDKTTKTVKVVDVNNDNQTLVGYYDNNAKKVWLNTASLSTRIKKIACLGDSITEGVNASGWQWHRYIDSWCKGNGIETTVINLGIGGTLVSDAVGNTAQAFVRRLDTIPTDADVVVVFGGTNDWGNNATLGAISDTGTITFYGAYKHILEWLAVNRPNAKVLTITPLKRYYRGSGTVWKNAQTEPNSKGNLLGDYVQAVKEVSDLYAVPCVDLHNDSGLNPVLEVVRTRYMGDGLHPTAEGNKRMYPVILDKMRPLLEYD